VSWGEVGRAGNGVWWKLSKRGASAFAPYLPNQAGGVDPATGISVEVATRMRPAWLKGHAAHKKGALRLPMRCDIEVLQAPSVRGLLTVAEWTK
jgi:hypothetical protein